MTTVLKPPFNEFGPDNPECSKLMRKLVHENGADAKEAWNWMKLVGGTPIDNIGPISDQFFDILKQVSPEWYEWTSLHFM